MADVHLEHHDEVYCRVVADVSTLMELAEHFSLYKDGYKWDVRVRNKLWDGKIRLLSRLTGLIYKGLAHRIKKYCDHNGYTFSFDDSFVYDNISLDEVKTHIDSLNIPSKFDEREYQLESITKCLRSKRRLLKSPTSSGKSYMIYVIAMWYKKKTLIIVPTIGLVKQMASDIVSYGFSGAIHTSTDGLLKDNNIAADIVITTWQSLDNGKKKMPQKWFDQFEVVFGDEAHGAKSPTMIAILSAMVNTKYRFGTTGTLAKNRLNNWTIEGLFGPMYVATTTRELIDQGYASDITIKCIVLRYSEAERKAFHAKNPVTKKYKTYPEEIDLIINHPARRKFIKNLVKSLQGNKLIFFKRREHGAMLYEDLKDLNNTFYIDGTVDVNVRESIRHAIEDEENANLVASMGTSAVGISINRLKNMIGTHPSKALIKLLQAIGRMLRLHAEKAETGAVFFDIVDDFTWGSRENFAITHFKERVKIYDEEKFVYRIYNVGLK